jgi:hypothetical protein
MMMAAVIGTDRALKVESVSSVVTICTQQKRVRPSSAGTPAILAASSQSDLQLAWRGALAALPADTPAACLYAGRAFGLAKEAARVTDSALYVASAGLGLVAGPTLVPPYGLTIARGGPESVLGKVVGPFSPAVWFESVLAGPHSTDWAHIVGAGSGRILVALTKPYAELVGESLSALPRGAVDRLRIFGAGLSVVLPSTLRSALVPYDLRLDALFPGTRSDFAQRAMLHFARLVTHLPVDRLGDAEAVVAALHMVDAPVWPKRLHRTDAELLAIIADRIAPHASASRLLRQLRDEDGIACEQGRFARLFRTAAASGVAS